MPADFRARRSAHSAQLLDSACQALETQRIDWRAVLQHRRSERIQDDWSPYPFSMRHIHRGLYLPSATLRVPDFIVFAIDTSGSMSDQTNAAIAAALLALQETFDGWRAFPERSPGHAVIWLIEGPHAAHVPFGSVLRLSQTNA